MLVKLRLSKALDTNWKEYSCCFFLGGLATVVAWLVAKGFGPVTGGLFLAFPAIFPASATIIETHQRERKRRNGLTGDRRARKAVVAEVKGTELGCLALAVFALAAWRTLPHWPPALAIGAAAVSWSVVAVCAWWLARRARRHF